MAKQTSISSRHRAFVAIALFISCLGLTVTGLTMATIHGGERAFEAWAHAHALFALVFIVFAAWHMVLNWRCMLNHFGLGSRK